MYGPASLRMYFRLIVQDVAVQYYVQHMDAHSLRNDKSKAFFDRAHSLLDVLEAVLCWFHAGEHAASKRYGIGSIPCST